ncbi:restriction endonuclease subunit S [Micromonospora sp.]|uniref:restriction endonuclease subunit S n=1 Tax=Micromonospora sp. TaxID=1876 RepID=UPI003B3B8447
MSWKSTTLRAVAEVDLGRQRAPQHENGSHIVSYLRAANVKDGSLDLNDVLEMNFTPKEQQVFALKPGDLLMTEGSGSRSVVGASAFWRGEIEGTVCFQNTLLRLRPRPELIDGRFLSWWVKGARESGLLASIAGGANIYHLGADRVRQLPLMLPPIEEQRRIADFLDAETARMTRLQSRYERVLELLEERGAVMVRSLIAGQDVEGGYPGNDLRVPWLGEVPAAWAITTLGRISRTYTGTTFPREFQGMLSGDLPFVKVSDFSRANERSELRDSANWVTRQVAVKLGGRVVPRGAILYARVGAAMLLNQRRLTTRDAIVDDNVRGVLFAAGHVRYWLHVLGAVDLAAFANPGPVPSVSESQVAAIPVPFPPVAEQILIADRIDAQLEESHRSKILLSRQVSLLQERRRSVITAAVSGEIDVTTACGWTGGPHAL